ncbi:MAG: type II secretion system protein [Phycisphaerae bacterium]|nr:type II secretion system protein [Phycisphaerae bacterium]
MIELLVVIAIISLLVSILLPSLQAAKEQARIAKCLSTLRSFGLTLNMYANENDGSIPPDFYPGSPPDCHRLRQSWPWLLAPYLDIGIMRVNEWGTVRPAGIVQYACPSADPIVENDLLCLGGYAMNTMLDGQRWNTGGSEYYVAPPKLDDLNANLVYLGDGMLRPAGSDTLVMQIMGRTYDPTISNEDFEPNHHPSFRHNGGEDRYPPAFLDSDSANFVFIGGHAGNVRHEDRDELWIDPSNH